MKKVIAAILVLCMLLSIAACTAEDKKMKTDIIGEWMAVSVNASATFKEDGTGELSYNGTHSVTWEYDPDQDRYIVTGNQTYKVYVGKEYSMPYMSLDGIDFYNPDDYGNAYTLMLSKRFEDITNLTAEMTKVELNASYDIANGVTICFMDISRYDTESGDGLQVNYTISNNRAQEVTESLSLALQGRFYLADQHSAVTISENVELVTNIAAGEMAMESCNFSLGTDTQLTLDTHATVIGILYFELYGQEYYIDLSEWFRK